MKPEQQGAHAKMSTSSSPLVGLRAVVSFLFGLFILASTASLLMDRSRESQVQLAVEHRHLEVRIAAAGNQESQVRWTGELMGEAASGSGEKECDLSVGRWVYDNTSQPLYSGRNCSFILDEVACEKYGQNDTKYQHWRWQPDGCDLQRYALLVYMHACLSHRMNCQSGFNLGSVYSCLPQPQKCSISETTVLVYFLVHTRCQYWSIFN
jgi:hypothetical protein